MLRAPSATDAAPIGATSDEVRADQGAALAERGSNGVSAQTEIHSPTKLNCEFPMAWRKGKTAKQKWNKTIVSWNPGKDRN